jgi:hypothetical protein
MTRTAGGRSATHAAYDASCSAVGVNHLAILPPRGPVEKHRSEKRSDESHTQQQNQLRNDPSAALAERNCDKRNKSG